jgi:hypothetical protein
MFFRELKVEKIPAAPSDSGREQLPYHAAVRIHRAVAGNGRSKRQRVVIQRSRGRQRHRWTRSPYLPAHRRRLNAKWHARASSTAVATQRFFLGRACLADLPMNPILSLSLAGLRLPRQSAPRKQLDSGLGEQSDARAPGERESR